MRLKDKVAIVTGAASGIGKEIAIIFAREGAKVAIADLDQKAADATAREIDPTGKRVVGVAMDVANEQQVDDGTAKVVEIFGSLDVLISNAGIQIVAPLVDFEFAKWKRLMAIHLDGAFLTTRAALRQMYKQKSGCVIYMGSVHSKEASVLKIHLGLEVDGSEESVPEAVIVKLSGNQRLERLTLRLDLEIKGKE